MITNRFTPEQRAELERRQRKPVVVSAVSVPRNSATGNIGSSPLSVPVVQAKHSPVGVTPPEHRNKGGCGAPCGGTVHARGTS